MLKFDKPGRLIFSTAEGFVGLGWTTAGVRRLILGMTFENTEKALDRTCSDLPLMKRGSGELNLKRLKKLSDEDVITELTKVRGIGRWSAQMYLIFHLGRLDVLPTGDLGLQVATARGYGFDENATADEMEKTGARWAPCRSMASWYLWRGLDGGGL